jgi:hypothetical protein
MAKRKTGEQWRTFLRWLGRTGNARLAARQAGMNVATAYDRKIKDDGFAAKWEAMRAKAKARPPSPQARTGKGADLVARKTRHGTQLIRAGLGRWSAKVEAAFRAALRRTGCVRAAARACGLSTTALYNRRANYPAFAAAWAADEAFAKERIPELLSAATIASLDPEIDEADLPRVNIDQAIAIARLKCGGGSERGRGRWIRRDPTVEEMRDEVLRRIAAIKRHREKGQDPAPPDGEGS